MNCVVCYRGVWTLGQPASRAERSGISPTNPLFFSRFSSIYPEMSGISVNELCFESAKIWILNFKNFFGYTVKLLIW